MVEYTRYSYRYSPFLPIPAVTARVHMFPQDDGVSSMLPFLDSACDFIHQQRQRGAVLVHCKGGINRSPCLVVAYLMKYEQLALAEALELCSLARPVAR